MLEQRKDGAEKGWRNGERMSRERMEERRKDE